MSLIIMLNVVMLSIIMLNFVMLSVVMLVVIMLSVVVLNVMAPAYLPLVFHNSWAELFFTKTTLKLLTSSGLLVGALLIE
jgi:hypothetical protein